MTVKDILPLIQEENCYIIISTPSYRRFTYNRSYKVPEKVYNMNIESIYGCDFYGDGGCIELQIREEI